MSRSGSDDVPRGHSCPASLDAVVQSETRRPWTVPSRHDPWRCGAASIREVDRVVYALMKRRLHRTRPSWTPANFPDVTQETIMTKRKKNHAVFDCTVAALEIADTVESMLSRSELRVRERLRAGESVEVAVSTLSPGPRGMPASLTQSYGKSVACSTTNFDPSLSLSGLNSVSPNERMAASAHTSTLPGRRLQTPVSHESGVCSLWA